MDVFSNFNNPLLNTISNNPQQDDLLTPGNKEANSKIIGDNILNLIKQNWINNPENTPEIISLQIKKDLISFYYKNINGEKKVDPEIEKQICNTWCIALKTRFSNIKKEIPLLLKREQRNVHKGGGNIVSETSSVSSPLADGFKGIGSFSEMLSKETQLSQTNTNDNRENEKNDILFKKLVQNKYEIYDEIFKQKPFGKSATVRNVRTLHENLISKILCNYSVINRKILVERLRNILLGNRQIEQNSKSINQLTENNSIYDLFITKLKNMSNINYTNQSSATPKQSTLVKTEGGGNQIPIYNPSAYIWDRITNYVDGEIKKEIKAKMSKYLIPEKIKSAFKDVFLQVNCDSLDLSNDILNDFLKKEFHSLLEVLCQNIPDKYAISILQNYISNNFENFTKSLNNIFMQIVTAIDAYSYNYENIASKIKDVINIEYPKFVLNQIPSNKENDELDKSCDKQLNTPPSSSGTSELVKMKNSDANSSFFNHFETTYLMPVFDVLKTNFYECTEDIDFLKELFDMYSGRSIKFAKQIQLQFESDDVDDYIQKYILTKHPYTLKIISECIKHVADIKFTKSFKLQNSTDLTTDGQEFTNILSQYAAFLMHSGAFDMPDINMSHKTPFIDFINKQLPIFFRDKLEIKAKIQKFIIGKAPQHQIKSYNESLQNIFSINKSSVSKNQRYTRKRRPKIVSINADKKPDLTKQIPEQKNSNNTEEKDLIEFDNSDLTKQIPEQNPNNTE